jgi:hypothetical protein
MTEKQWLGCADPVSMIERLRELSWERLSRFAAAYSGRPYHALSPQVLSAGSDPGTGPYLWMAQADDHDNQWAEPWDPAAALPLLRCLFGSLFRPVSFSPAWRTDTAVALARQMYESRDFSAMPLLADALQDAGCDNEGVLDHCRGEGPHVRGCWVVDLVLGKE